MARLDILVHRGCLSEPSIRTLASELKLDLPHWDISVRAPTHCDEDLHGTIISPAFLVNDRVLVTGLPKKDWLLSRLHAWEQGER